MSRFKQARLIVTLLIDPGRAGDLNCGGLCVLRKVAPTIICDRTMLR